MVLGTVAAGLGMVPSACDHTPSTEQADAGTGSAPTPADAGTAEAEPSPECLPKFVETSKSFDSERCRYSIVGRVEMPCPTARTLSVVYANCTDTVGGLEFSAIAARVPTLSLTGPLHVAYLVDKDRSRREPQATGFDESVHRPLLESAVAAGASISIWMFAAAGATKLVDETSDLAALSTAVRTAVGSPAMGTPRHVLKAAASMARYLDGIPEPSCSRGQRVLMMPLWGLDTGSPALSGTPMLPHLRGLRPPLANGLPTLLLLGRRGEAEDFGFTDALLDRYFDDAANAQGRDAAEAGVRPAMFDSAASYPSVAGRIFGEALAAQQLLVGITGFVSYDPSVGEILENCSIGTVLSGLDSVYEVYATGRFPATDCGRLPPDPQPCRMEPDAKACMDGFYCCGPLQRSDASGVCRDPATPSPAACGNVSRCDGTRVVGCDASGIPETLADCSVESAGGTCSDAPNGGRCSLGSSDAGQAAGERSDGGTVAGTEAVADGGGSSASSTGPMDAGPADACSDGVLACDGAILVSCQDGVALPQMDCARTHLRCGDRGDGVLSCVP